MMDENDLRTRVWSIYHDIQLLEDMGFSPIGYPPMNPDDSPDTVGSLAIVDKFNSEITLVRFGPCDSVLTARPCEDVFLVKINGAEYEMPRAAVYCEKNVDGCIELWIKENVKDAAVTGDCKGLDTE